MSICFFFLCSCILVSFFFSLFSLVFSVSVVLYFYESYPSRLTYSLPEETVGYACQIAIKMLEELGFFKPTPTCHSHYSDGRYISESGFDGRRLVESMQPRYAGVSAVGRTWAFSFSQLSLGYICTHIILVHDLYNLTAYTQAQVLLGSIALCRNVIWVKGISAKVWNSAGVRMIIHHINQNYR